jgi:ATP-dependent Clp protease ATP-binding subunit ClpA
VQLTEPAKQWLAENGFDGKYGARPMARLIHDKIKQRSRTKFCSAN